MTIGGAQLGHFKAHLCPTLPFMSPSWPFGNTSWPLRSLTKPFGSLYHSQIKERWFFYNASMWLNNNVRNKTFNTVSPWISVWSDTFPNITVLENVKSNIKPSRYFFIRLWMSAIWDFFIQMPNMKFRHYLPIIGLFQVKVLKWQRITQHL